MSNIWGTIEADAWSRSFNYTEYIRYCELADKKPVTELEYDLLCTQFNAEMIADMQADEVEILRTENEIQHFDLTF